MIRALLLLPIVIICLAVFPDSLSLGRAFVTNTFQPSHDSFPLSVLTRMKTVPSLQEEDSLNR